MTKTLVLDDNPDFLYVLSAVLEAHGLEVTEFDSADDALQELSENQLREFDFVVTDLEMPGTRGDEFAMLVHQLNPQVRITIVSGAIKNVSVAAANIATLVEKPFSFETLAKKMLGSSKSSPEKAA